MGVTPRPWVDGIPRNQAGVPWVRSQVMAQAVRNVRQVGQGQRSFLIVMVPPGTIKPSIRHPQQETSKCPTSSTH